ncbi:MAG: acyl-protein synthetase [bacterium]|nr:acyl-protein synthetase [bacterium]
MPELSERIKELLARPVYGSEPAEKAAHLFPVLRDLIREGAASHPGLANYYAHEPRKPEQAATIADLPFLPVAAFKQDPPLAFVEPERFVRVLQSSATTGQVPSSIALDRETSKRMSKGVAAITADFIGKERRPYLVADVAGANAARLGARGAAIQGLMPFASESTYCMTSDDAGGLSLDLDTIQAFADAHRGRPVLVYGFTYILWLHLVEPLRKAGVRLDLPDVHVLHSGGWKKLQERSVDKATLTSGVAEVFGCTPDRVIDFYGMVENVGVIYPDCRAGHKHAPAFAEVLIRDPLTLEPSAPGEDGLLQVCSALPTSFPGHALLTEDLGRVVEPDGCECGRRGPAFRFIGRAPESEVRGCGNVYASRRAITS